MSNRTFDIPDIRAQLHAWIDKQAKDHAEEWPIWRVSIARLLATYLTTRKDVLIPNIVEDVRAKMWAKFAELCLEASETLPFRYFIGQRDVRFARLFKQARRHKFGPAVKTL